MLDIRPLWSLLAAAAFAGTAAAQTPVRIGETVTARLTQSDQAFGDGSRYKFYGFQGTKGQVISADMTSDDLDPNLILADGLGNPLVKDDDGGGNCAAHLTYTLPADGAYRLYANSTSPGELGEFRLSLAAGRTAAAKDSTCRSFGAVAGVIEVGRKINGKLTRDDPFLRSDSTYFQRWLLSLQAKQTVTVELDSKDFDAYVLLVTGRGQKLAENNNGGGNCNARLVYTAADDHPVRVVVNSAGKLQTGRFTLRVSEGAAPVDPKGSCQQRRDGGGR